MGNPVVHFEVVGKNPQALQTFNKEAFDWQIGDPMPGALALAIGRCERRSARARN